MLSSKRHAVPTLTAALLFAAPLAMAQDADGPAQHIIIQWKSSQQQATQTSSMARTRSDLQARYGTPLISQRSLATGAEVIKVERRLSRSDLDGLIAALAADPAVLIK